MPTDEVAPRTTSVPPVAVTGPSELPSLEADAVLDGAAVAPEDLTVLDVTGPGTIPCLQGMLTNDIETPGQHGFVYGAVLTPKGMIICDVWAARDGGRLKLFAPNQGREQLLEVFKQFLPPRLARVSDVSAEVATLRLVGPRAIELIREAEFSVPEAGQAGTGRLDGVACHVARPRIGQPFGLQISCPREERERLIAALAAAGITAAGSAALELARITGGWPRLKAEIDQKTLPQEVRFDEHGGVSYSKGCYTGQETVARLHFRGHANRYLAGLIWEDRSPDFSKVEITLREKMVGRVGSAVWLERLEQFIGLGVVRREVDTGEIVTAASAPAEIVDLPFQFG